MKQLLKKITDLTITDLLKEEIILPSTYFKKFNKHAKKLEINIEDENFTKEINQIMTDELEDIEKYMQSIELNIQTMKQVTKDSKKALKENDIDSINNIFNKMTLMEEEVNQINNRIYKDDLSKTYNRKWIYNRFLDEHSQFKNTGIVILINIVDYDYIKNEYGELIANNFILFTINFLKKHLSEINIEFEIAKYFDDKFLIFTEKTNEKEINNFFFNMKKSLLNTTLKSNSGLILKGNIDYFISAYNNKQNSQEVLEKIFSQFNKE